VNTVSPHLAVATVLAAHHLGALQSSEARQNVSGATGAVVLTIAALIVAGLAAASAVRSIVALLSELLRAVAALSALLTLFVTVLLGVVLLLHR
jgi:hypothetical protein